MPKPYTSRAEYYYGALTEGYSGDLPRPQSREDYYLLKLIDQMNKISGQTVFTPKGTVQNVTALPSLTDATAGDIYNIKVDSKTTADFIEGSGVTIKGGSNVYCVLDDNNNKKWDCLGTTYAVDYALDPGSGSPIANNAVCAAIDNVVDQLNPVTVNQIKRIHLPSMATGQCCKILDIDGYWGAFGTVVVEITNVVLNIFGNSYTSQIILPCTYSGEPRFMTMNIDEISYGIVGNRLNGTTSLYAINTDSAESTETYFDICVRMNGYYEDTSLGHITPIVYAEPTAVDVDTITFTHTGKDTKRIFTPSSSSGVTGNMIYYVNPHGNSYAQFNLRNVRCSAGDAIATASTSDNIGISSLTLLTCWDPASKTVYHAYVSGLSLCMLEDCSAERLVGVCPLVTL